MQSIKLLLSAILVAGICQTPRASNRIVGGEDAKEGQFPHQVSLRRQGKHICGGSIISPNYILTAAHCVVQLFEDGTFEPLAANEFSILAGSTNRMEGGVVKQVVDVKRHEEYHRISNDLALLKLESPLEYTDNIKAIPLATTEVPPNEEVVISGWGLMSTTGIDAPIKLQWNTLKSMSKKQCFLAVMISSNSLICLAHPENNGACLGDSGGPAVYNNELVGVAGFVLGSCGSTKPDGYAKVSYHYDWILKNSDL